MIAKDINLLINGLVDDFEGKRGYCIYTIICTELCEKNYEVRLAYINNSVFAIRIDS